MKDRWLAVIVNVNTMEERLVNDRKKGINEAVISEELILINVRMIIQLLIRELAESIEISASGTVPVRRRHVVEKERIDLMITHLLRLGMLFLTRSLKRNETNGVMATMINIANEEVREKGDIRHTVVVIGQRTTRVETIRRQVVIVAMITDLIVVHGGDHVGHHDNGTKDLNVSHIVAAEVLVQVRMEAM